MHLKFLESITQPSSNGLCKVTAICWSPSGKKLAVCTADRVVQLFDENGAKKDKFSTKPAEKGPKNYLVVQMAFSPQSDKLAIAQSDNMVFVYKIGNDWGEKKSICNKFQHPSSTTSLLWPVKRPNELFFGIAEGQVRAGNLKTHKTTTLYSSESYVTSMAGNMENNGFVSGHIDGSIYIYYFDSADRGARLIVRHPCPPFALAWGQSIVVGSNEGRVYFYDTDGTEEQMLDVTDRGTNFQETSAAVCNPTGDVVVFGGFDALLTVVKNKDSMSWDVDAVTTVENMYSVTTMDWKPDGDRLVVGNVCGAVNLYDISIKRALYKGGFELTYVSVSQVIVRQLESNLRIVLRSQYGREITKTNIYQGRYVVAHTSDTILLGDLETLKLSEIAWQGGSNEKFIFDNASACIIFAAGEATIVEYGIDDILGSVRTSFVSSHVISLRINERVMRPTASGTINTNTVENKKVAYLLDAQTICVRDLVTQSVVQIPHDSKIDWLELNARADVLLFRDKKRYLHMFNVTTQVRCQLLNFCTYVQWVPGSDVIVAQNRGNLCVWYNVSAPDQITSIPIKGDVEDIERAEGRTEVIVDEGLSQAVYPLDESLISFSTALDDAEFFRAMDILEKLVLGPDVEAMWRQLKIVALKAGEVRVAQRCCAALGDVPLSQYLGQIIAIGKKAETDFGIHSADHYQVRCKLALLKKDFDVAEHILINQGKIEECIAMYQKFHRYDEAIRVAQENKHPDLHDMRRTYFQLLLDTNQHERAAMLKVVECDFVQAINLFLKGGMPGKAAQVIIDNNIMQPLQLLDTVATSLTRAGMHDKAGEFYERLNELPRALESYVRGNAYRKAVDLARKCFPARVVELQEAWGDYLVSIKQVDMAINHYIEAKVNRKAIEAAVSARQFSRALQLVDAIDKDSARPYYRQLARHYEDGRQYELAERCYVAADQAHSAVEMHTKLGNWDMAHSIARKYMKEEDVGMLYISQGQKMEAKGRLKDAEKLYLAVKEPRLAINMYKKHKRYEDMIRLVQEHHPEMLKETHKFLANTYEMEGSFRDAEHHHVEAQEWHAAVNMYRFNELWDDAIRVAKFHGGIGACKRVTLAILTAAGVPEGSKYLTKHGLVEAAIDYAAETGAFDLATDLATQLLPKKLPDVYLKYALLLEDDEKYDQAEGQFLRAGKPKEAIEMYIHVSDWKSALRVAESHDSSAIPTVYVAHATERVAAKAYGEAEDLYLAASKPEQALSMYQEAEMWQDAIRVAQKHLPHRVAEFNSMYHSAQARAGKGSSKTDFVALGRQLEQSRQWGQAIDVYLSARAGKVDAAVEVEELWERAVEIARANVPNRYVEVASDVARRLVEIKREEAAADTLFEAGRQDEAIQLLINAKKFDKARALAKGNSQFKKRVDDAYQSFLITKEDTKELAELGHSEEAIELLAKRGDWNRVWELLSKQSVASTTVAKYVLQRVDELIRNGDSASLEEAVAVLTRQNAPTTESALRSYRNLAFSLLSKTIEEETPSLQMTVSNFREVLYQVTNKLRSVDKRTQTDALETLMAVHYQNLLNVARRHGLKDIAAKCGVTLLKYPDLVPCDKGFYQAGLLCREQGNMNLAFLLFNRYVDIAEAIDSADVSMLDQSDLSEADGIPNIDKLPIKHYLRHEDDREEVRTWVLSVVTDSTIEQRLPGRESSRNTLYDGLYHSDRATCVVTGYPIYAADLLEVNNSTVNRRDWNALVAKTRTDPWTGQAQNPLY